MAEKLTPQQQMAVTDRGGKLLVSAAAGSGKTKVLVDRLMGYLTDEKDPADLDSFLIITYTKAAASELRVKIGAKLSERIAQEPENRHLQRQLQRLYLTKISTVHAFCADLLREYAYKLDISADFRVADEMECAILRRNVMEQLLDDAYLSTDEDFIAFVDTQGLGRNDLLVPQIIEQVYDSARCHLDPDSWLEKCLKDVQLQDVQDASQTTWGRFLMEDLFSYLDSQITAMERCAALAEAAPGLEKPGALLRDTVYQLRVLRGSKTWDEIVSHGKIDFGRLTFPRKFDDPELTERIKAVRAACKAGVEKKLTAFADESGQVLADLARSSGAVRGMLALVKAFSQRYDSAKRGYRILDFGDLEHKTLDLLLGKRRLAPTATAAEIAQRFREIMVDEYQDSNVVQDAIFASLTEKRQNLFMVGDVKQSIYQFRLADPGIFLKKYAEFTDAENAQPGQGRKVLLSSNFRSSGGVISAVNDVFTACMSPAVGGLAYTQAEQLREGLPHVSLGEPEVEFHGVCVRDDTYAEEADFVAQRIEQLLSAEHRVRQGDTLRPIQPEDIVILLRSPGSVGGQFRNALERRGIRSTTGGGVDILQTEEVSALRALLQIISNPRQDIPLIGAMLSALFGFTADDLAAIRGKNKRCCFYDAVCQDTSERAVSFCAALTELRREARMNTLTKLLEKIILLTDLESIYGSMAGGEGRKANLQSFYALASSFEARGGKSLDAFLEHLDSMEEEGVLTAGDMNASGCVTIMSIHKSKGLEFPVVFLCGLSRRFNREDLRAQVLCHKEMGIGLSCVDAPKRVRYPAISKKAIAVRKEAESLSEELRVLYVGMTRARDRLIMTYASNSLEDELKDIALRMDICSKELMTGSVSKPGEWLLYAALRRTEAGAFHGIGDRPQETFVSDAPWRITVAQAPEAISSAQQQEYVETYLPEEALLGLQAGLNFTYPHQTATLAPSKQTATGRKGRYKDQEAAENATEQKPYFRSWRKPLFVQPEREGKEYGNAIHGVLQYIRYEACTDGDAISREVKRLQEQGLITQEQAALVDCDKLTAFFMGELGRRLRSSKHVLREFKFSILDDGTNFDSTLVGEQILLQGVVDCAILEDDGITVIDFKTDRVKPDGLAEKLEHYRPQVEAYADALERIYEKKVKQKILYFFSINKAVTL